MKNFILPFLFTAFAASAQDTPKMAVERFFAAFHAKDTAALRQVLHKTATMHSVSERRDAARLSAESIGQLLKSIAAIPSDMKFEEKLLSINEQVDGSMAHVWTPYEFYVNGTKSHGGVNSFHLFNDAGQWKILHIADTRRK